VGAQAIEIPNGLVQNLVSGLILNFDTKRLARKIPLASGLLAEIACTLGSLVLDGFEVRQVGALLVRN
jgi:hypothetical protein